MGQINNQNFFRWFTGSNADQSVNLPRLGITDAKNYLPALVVGETTGFYINADVPFYDADDFTQLALNICDYNGNTIETVLPVGGVLKQVPLANGYRMYASFTVPNLPVGQYYYSIYNLATQTVKCISNYFQVIDSVSANLYTVSVQWQNSRDAYYYDWSQVPDFFCQLRLHLSLTSYQPEETIDQTKAVSTGLRRNNNYDVDFSYKLNSYYFDDGANLACVPLFGADTLIINGKNYIQKSAYLPNVRPNSLVNVGEIELYDQYFSTINKYGNLPQPVNAAVSAGNYLVINNSDKVLNAYAGVPSGAATLLQAIQPNSVYNIPISAITSQNNVYFSYVSTDNNSVTAYFISSNLGVYALASAQEISGTNFGNATFAQLNGNQYVLVFGPDSTAAVLPFAFPAKTGEAESTLITSASITVGGINTSVPISIAGDSGAAYSKNGGAFTSAPGTVVNGDVIQVQVESSAGPSTQTSCTLTIGTQTGAFNVTTAAVAQFQEYLINEGHSFATSALACAASTGGTAIYTNTNSINLVVGTQFYTDQALTTKFSGDGVNYYSIDQVSLNIKSSCQISSTGVITSISNC